MGTLNRITYPTKSVRREVVTLYSAVVLGATGAISSQDTLEVAGFALTKTAGKTGRYTVSIASGSKVPKLHAVSVTLIGVADAAFTDAKGLLFHTRNNTVSTTGAFEIQAINPETAADAEVEDNLTMLIEITVGYV